MTTTVPQHTADLVVVDRALESWRDSGYDLTAAVGEVVDNSIEAKASHIRVRTNPENITGSKSITSIAFADDGVGIPVETLPHVLSMGFSTRYGKRDGMGRFGVGLKLATLSLAQRIDIYTRHEGGDGQIWHASLDLEEIRNLEQKHITAEPVADWPEEHADLMERPGASASDAGTLVVWSKIDRLTGGGTYKTDLASRFKQLQNFLARAYRKFLDKGVNIELNGKVITLHDPLFLLENPRVKEKLGVDARGEIVEQGTIELDGHTVSITVATVPKELRPKRGQGGSAIAADLHIPDNEGRISFVRQGREINYDQVARMFPSRIEEIDRWLGVEVEFPAALDEYFQVRHIKRGVVPVDKLRDEIRRFVARPINAARKEIRTLWDETAAKEAQEKEQHRLAAEAAARVEQTSPKGRAGSTMTESDEATEVDRVARELTAGTGDGDSDGAGGTDGEATPEVVEKKSKQLRDSLASLPITIVDSTWPGRELLDITHLNAKAIVKVNHGHAFFKEIYDPVRDMASRPAAEVEGSEALRLLRRVEVALDALIMAYAKAENMDREPDQKYADLRSYWGQFAASYLKEALKDL